jgi:DNA-binding transcriptional LysR family regulator
LRQRLLCGSQSTLCVDHGQRSCPPVDLEALRFLRRFRRIVAREIRAVGIDTYLSWGGPANIEVDVAIAAIEEAAPGVHVSPLYEEKSVLVTGARHLSTRSRLTRTQLSNLRHVDVQVAPGRGFRRLAQLYAGLGIERRVVMTVPSFIAAASVVAETDYVATLPASLVEVFRKH